MYHFQAGDRPFPGMQIVRPVDCGGFGEVYAGVTDQGKQVALKWLWRNPAVELRGVRECLNLRHTHLVQVYDLKETPDGHAWVIMEWVNGMTLAGWLTQNPQGLGVRQVATWIAQLASVLDHLHARGVVHRDLKPANVFVEEGQIKLGDFGLAKQVWPSSMGPHSECVGTVHYMAPEVARGEYSAASDVYSLAVLAHELLCGRRPFAGETPAEVLMRHLTEEPGLELLPESLRGLFSQALAKVPAQRPATAGEFARVLVALAESVPENSFGLVPVAPADPQPKVTAYPKPVPVTIGRRRLSAGRTRPSRAGLMSELRHNPAIPVCLAVTALFLIPLVWTHSGNWKPMSLWLLVTPAGVWLHSRFRCLVRSTQRPGAIIRLVR